MSGRDYSAAAKKWTTFTTFDVDDVRYSSSLKIPQEMRLAGEATKVWYRSDKWNAGKMENYVHEHDGGVRFYMRDADGPERRVPDYIFKTESVVLLGDCLAFEFRAEDGEVLGTEFGRKRPQLYCIPSGKCLLVIEGHRRILAMMWGGKLTVTAHGIEG